MSRQDTGSVTVSRLRLKLYQMKCSASQKHRHVVETLVEPTLNVILRRPLAVQHSEASPIKTNYATPRSIHGNIEASTASTRSARQNNPPWRRATNIKDMVGDGRRATTDDRRRRHAYMCTNHQNKTTGMVIKCTKTWNRDTETKQPQRHDSDKEATPLERR